MLKFDQNHVLSVKITFKQSSRMLENNHFDVEYHAGITCLIIYVNQLKHAAQGSIAHILLKMKNYICQYEMYRSLNIRSWTTNFFCRFSPYYFHAIFTKIHENLNKFMKIKTKNIREKRLNERNVAWTFFCKIIADVCKNIWVEFEVHVACLTCYKSPRHHVVFQVISRLTKHYIINAFQKSLLMSIYLLVLSITTQTFSKTCSSQMI